jgi:hypothetical protein
MTTIVVQGTSGDSLYVRYDIVFSGNSAKSYTLASSGNVFTITTTPIKNPNGLQVYTSNSGAKLTISNYGTTGGTISGTYSGSFDNTGTTYTISSGTFTANVQ